MTAVRGHLRLDAQACTSCMLCVRECPSWCIDLTARNEPDDAPPIGGGAKARTKLVLQSFDVDYGLCMFCGVCVDVCPFDALSWEPEPVEPGARSGSATSLMPPPSPEM